MLFSPEAFLSKKWLVYFHEDLEERGRQRGFIM